MIPRIIFFALATVITLVPTTEATFSHKHGEGGLLGGIFKHIQEKLDKLHQHRTSYYQQPSPPAVQTPPLAHAENAGQGTNVNTYPLPPVRSGSQNDAQGLAPETAVQQPAHNNHQQGERFKIEFPVPTIPSLPHHGLFKHPSHSHKQPHYQQTNQGHHYQQTPPPQQYVPPHVATPVNQGTQVQAAQPPPHVAPPVNHVSQETYPIQPPPHVAPPVTHAPQQVHHIQTPQVQQSYNEGSDQLGTPQYPPVNHQPPNYSTSPDHQTPTINHQQSSSYHNHGHAAPAPPAHQANTHLTGAGRFVQHEKENVQGKFEITKDREISSHTDFNGEESSSSGVKIETGIQASQPNYPPAHTPAPLPTHATVSPTAQQRPVMGEGHVVHSVGVSGTPSLCFPLVQCQTQVSGNQGIDIRLQTSGAGHHVQSAATAPGGGIPASSIGVSVGTVGLPIMPEASLQSSTSIRQHQPSGEYNQYSEHLRSAADEEEKISKENSPIKHPSYLIG